MAQWVHPTDALTQRKVFQRRRLTNLSALCEIGFSANRRLLGVPRLSHNPIRAEQAFTAVHHPIITSDGHRIAGLRLGDRRPRAALPSSAYVDPSHPFRPQATPAVYRSAYSMIVERPSALRSPRGPLLRKRHLLSPFSSQTSRRTAGWRGVTAVLLIFC